MFYKINKIDDINTFVHRNSYFNICDFVYTIKDDFSRPEIKNASICFDDLPVIIVNDYREISEDFLNQKYEEMKYKKYNYEKLYIHYWKNLIEKSKI